MSLPIQKSATNCATANLEIGNQKLYHCQFRKWQPKTLPLLIQKLAAKLCRCKFRNQQPKTFLLSIQKSAPKLSLPIQKSAANYASTK
jgi:hypothetical protein